MGIFHRSHLNDGYLFQRWGWMRNSKKVTVKGRNIVDVVFIGDKSKKNVACELCETAKHLENHMFFFPSFFHVFSHVSQVR
jgi:hypothetical protein